MECKAPTANQQKKLAEAASSCLKQSLDLDDDDSGCCLMTVSVPQLESTKSAVQGSNAPVALVPAAKVQGRRVAAKPKARAKLPQVAASQARKDTLKLYTSVMASHKQALRQAPDALKEAAQAYDNSIEMALSKDDSVRTIKVRQECLQMLANADQTRPCERDSGEMLAQLRTDAYFAEQDWQAQAVQTVGQINYTRSVALDLQRTSAAVDELAAVHKESLQVLQTVAAALVREITSWRANMVAMKKAREQELEAERRAKEREKRAQEKQRLADERKAKRKADAEAAKQKSADAKAAAAAAAAAAEGPGAADAPLDGADGANRANKRRRKGPKSAAEVTDGDLQLIKCISAGGFDRSLGFDVCADLELFLDRILTTGGYLMHLGCCLLRSTDVSIPKCSSTAEAACQFWRV